MASSGSAPGARSTVGRLIRQRRLALGLTQEQAADLAGVSVGSWRSTEAGSRRPRPHTFAAILAALDLSAREVHEAVGPDDADADQQELLRTVAEELPVALAPVLLQVVRLVIAGYEVSEEGTPLRLPELIES